jgi:hypothetical protein
VAEKYSFKDRIEDDKYIFLAKEIKKLVKTNQSILTGQTDKM